MLIAAVAQSVRARQPRVHIEQSGADAGPPARSLVEIQPAAPTPPNRFGGWARCSTECQHEKARVEPWPSFICICLPPSPHPLHRAVLHVRPHQIIGDRVDVSLGHCQCLMPKDILKLELVPPVAKPL